MYLKLIENKRLVMYFAINPFYLYFGLQIDPFTHYNATTFYVCPFPGFVIMLLIAKDRA